VLGWVCGGVLKKAEIEKMAAVMKERFTGERVMTAKVLAFVNYSEPLFSTPQAAIRFALNTTGTPERPAMNKVADSSKPAGKGLGGLDGAGQAGVIRSLMHKLGPLGDAVLVARAAPRTTRCECKRLCCSGFERNLEWDDACSSIAHDAIKGAPSNAVFVIRRLIIRNIFGERGTVPQIAQECNADVEIVAKHHRAISRWIKGAPAGRNSELIEGVENIAWREIETLLRAANLLEE
jgi:hypothetical protein